MTEKKLEKEIEKILDRFIMYDGETRAVFKAKEEILSLILSHQQERDEKLRIENEGLLFNLKIASENTKLNLKTIDELRFKNIKLEADFREKGKILKEKLNELKSNRQSESISMFDWQIVIDYCIKEIDKLFQEAIDEKK